MIKRLSFLVLVVALLSCSSSEGERESQGSSEVGGSLAFQSRSEGSFIPEEVTTNLVGERRGRLSKLYANSPSWFSFQITESFDVLKIMLAGKKSSYTLTWNAKADEDGSDVLTFKNVNQGDFSVDILLTPGQVEVFFNEGLESFAFKTNNQSIDAKVEVYLDNDSEPRDFPGALYNLGS